MNKILPVFVLKVIFFSLAVLPWFLTACEGPVGPEGQQGIQGEKGDSGADGLSIVWMGEHSSAPAEAVENWAYYNTTTGNAYIYDGRSWRLLAKDGVVGADGVNGVSIQWQGEMTNHPLSPQLNWAYYNSIEKMSFVFDGNQWQILAKDGKVGPEGPQGPKGDAGEDGTSILWQGELDAAPPGAKLNWAYFNKITGNAYIYDGTSWQLLAKSGVSIVWQGEFPDEDELIETKGEPLHNWAYYNSTDKCSYIFDGTEWQILAKDGLEHAPPIEVIKRGGVVFTFDDRFVDDWYDLHNLLDNTGWRATFFLDRFHTYNSSQINKLQRMQEYGHEFGHHSSTHARATDYVRDYGIDAYLENEIHTQKRLMAEYGFSPTSFAYPYGSRNLQLDTALFDVFSILRGVSGIIPEGRHPSQLICYYNNNNLVFGHGIDDSPYNHSMEYLYSILDYVKNEDKVVIFLAHRPRRVVTADYQISYLRMVELIKYINDNNMHFYRISDLLEM